MDKETVRLVVNGTSYERAVEPRLLLSDFLRDELPTGIMLNTAPSGNAE